MTPESQRIAIAEACGWNNVHPFNRWKEGKYHMDGCLVGDGALLKKVAIPNYCHDLNACAAMERTIEPCDWGSYTMHIRRIIQRDCDKAECYVPGADRAQLIADFWFYHATAPQRCEAFLRAKGLWKEVA